LDVNNRAPLGNPRRGGRYAVTFHRYDDTEIDLFSFNRVDIDLQHYVPIVRDRRVLALHARAVMTDADAGAEVPFYFQPTLGGPDDLRGFRHFRFRDRNTLLFQAEYRWEIFTAVDGALFYDIGKVAPRREDFRLSDFERDFGIGFRFGTSQRRVPPNRGCIRQFRGRALHHEVRPCLLDAGRRCRSPRSPVVALHADDAERHAGLLPDDPLQVDKDRALDAGKAVRIEGSNGYDFAEQTFLKPGDLRPIPAVNVNTIDEVPDSSWFTNRIGRPDVGR
jgi:hypothetical protein